MRRRLAAIVLPVAVLIACSSEDDDISSADMDGGAREASTTYEADASVKSDARSDAPEGAAPPQEFSGQATYYAADGTGACGFKASPNDLNVAAMNGSQYKKALCGQCVLVTGPKGTVKVRIVDLCPGCGQGGLDLSKQAFSAIAALSAGRVPITWHFVPC